MLRVIFFRVRNKRITLTVQYTLPFDKILVDQLIFIIS